MKPNKITPVFIGGCERSGTTMLGSLLGAHSKCLCVPESQFKVDLLRNKEVDISANILLDLHQITEELLKNIRYRLWNIRASIKIEHISSYQDFLLEIIKLYATVVGKSEYKYWVDHTPANIQYTDTLLEMFPNSKFIHIVRDGRAVAASILPLDWGPNVITKAADMWKAKLSYGLAAELRYGEDKFMRIRYEDLVLCPEKSLSKICEFIGIQFEELMIERKGFEPPKYTKKQHHLVGKKPDRTRIDSWKKKLSRREIEIFEYLTGDLLQILGYDMEFGLDARKVMKRERVIYGMREVILFNINRYINKFKKIRSTHNTM